MEVRILLKRVLLVWVLVTILVTCFGKISIAQSNAGRTAADFLSIGVGARAAGMGGAFTSISEGVQAAYWNPAGLTSVNGGEVLLGHLDWYQDLSLEHGSFAKQVNENSTVAVSMTYLNYGTINRYDNNGVQMADDITAYDWVGSVSYGINTSENFSIGLSLKYINQKIDDLRASAVAGDFGVKYQANRFTLAGFFGNIGTKMRFASDEEKLPATARFGVSFFPFSSNFVTAIEAEKNFEGNMIIRNGFEFNFNEQYFLRSGYNYYPDQAERSFGSGISFGAGFKHKVGEIDYAFSTADKYSNDGVHRFSLVFKFGQ